MPRQLSSLPSRLLALYVRWERIIVAVLLLLFLPSFTILLLRFRAEATELVPAEGGTYIEGSFGDLQALNPWFTVTNDVNRDIVSLIFAGLLKYNPVTRDIEEDLATLQVSPDGKVYTVTLKEDVYWHDSTDQMPHPVTAEDVVFTFKTIQDPAFPNSLLRQNFHGVTIEQIDTRTVQFRLEEPYGFFSSNLTLGLLPKKSFEGVPVQALDQVLDFGYAPVGAGPYRLKNVVGTELSTEVTLERWERSLPPPYRLERIVFRIFPNYSTLLSDLRNLDGIRVVPFSERGGPAVPNRFTALQYSLPQYVALFFNLNRPVLKERTLRLGLQLGINKQEIADAVGPSKVVDTPLLEIADDDWRYSYDANAAQGALYESDWYFPEKVHLQRLLEQREANVHGPLRMEPIAYLETGAVLTVTGSLAHAGTGHRLHGVPLQIHPAQSGAWIVALPTSGTSALKTGLNLLRLTDENNRTVDSFYLRRLTHAADFRRAVEEQKLVDQFLRSKQPDVPEKDRITAADLALDAGYLRKRKVTDPVSKRINDRGQTLSLTLLTSPSPQSYATAAALVARQWEALGVEVRVVIPETRALFEEHLLKREYDVLLFGQSLLDNFDSYPYWHSSGTQRISEDRSTLRIDAYNLSQYASFESDALLETIRGKYSDDERAAALTKLQDVLKRDVPAVYLYSPLYTFAHREDILGIELGYLSLHSDRFLTLHRWHTHQERVFKDGKSWFSFLPWVSSALLSGSQEQAVNAATSTGSDAL